MGCYDGPLIFLAKIYTYTYMNYHPHLMQHYVVDERNVEVLQRKLLVQLVFRI